MGLKGTADRMYFSALSVRYRTLSPPFMDKPESTEARLAELTDKVVAVLLELRPLCNDSTALPREARRIVREACELLQAIKADAVDMLHEGKKSDGGQSHAQ
jgi:hypothetical protein